MNPNDNPSLPIHEQAFEWPRQAIRDNNWAQAAQRWAVLRKAFPDHPATWLQAANAHIEAGELKEADNLLAHAREAFAEHPLSVTESALLAIRRKQWDVAESYLQQARENFPTFTQTWLKSALCAESQGKLDKAAEYCKRACQCSPDIPGPYIHYAELAMRNEQWDQALLRWKELRSRFPENQVGYQRAAEAARKLNRSKEARELLLTLQYGPQILDKETSKLDKKISGHIEHSCITRLLELIWTNAIFNLRSEVQRKYLGYGWWVLEPLLHMGVYYLVFGFLLQRGGENYPVFLLTGLIPWMWFMKSVSESSNSIVAGHNLMLQVGLPSIVFPLVSLLQASLKQIPIFLLLIVFLWAQNFPPGEQWWALIPVIATQILLTMTFAGVVAAVIPFMRDLSYLVPTGLTLLMFLSGIFYDYKMISAEWQNYFLMNPIAFLLKCYREIFIDGIQPDMLTLSWWGLGGVISCTILIFAYKRLRYIYPRVLME